MVQPKRNQFPDRTSLRELVETSGEKEDTSCGLM